MSIWESILNFLKFEDISCYHKINQMLTKRISKEYLKIAMKSFALGFQNNYDNWAKRLKMF